MIAMKKVLVKKWIPAIYSKNRVVRDDGTGCYSEDYITEGGFLEWGILDGNTVAIIMFKDGTTDLIPVYAFKFDIEAKN